MERLDVGSVNKVTLGGVSFTYTGTAILSDNPEEKNYISKISNCKEAHLSIDGNFKLVTINSMKRKPLYECFTPANDRFLFRGLLSDFTKCFGVAEAAIIMSSRRKKLTDCGWRFSRLSS